MCLYPTIRLNKKYVANKKNKGRIPEVKDKRVLHVPVSCGKCMECMKQKGRQWQVRLQEELRHNGIRAHMVTLTFSDKYLNKFLKIIPILRGYELWNEIATIANRRFCERWRKKYGKSIRHWLVTELGPKNTERIHLHGILWADDISLLRKIWKYGHVWVGDYVNERTINYIVKYIHKIDKVHPGYKGKVLTSPGIGKGYINRKDSEGNIFKGKDTREYYRTRQGTKLNMPIYYRNHIYNEEEKELLWLQKLDKEERWVDGNKVSVKEGDENYYKLLEIARAKNLRLGFGDNSIDWDKKRYNNIKRNLKKG